MDARAFGEGIAGLIKSETRPLRAQIEALKVELAATQASLRALSEAQAKGEGR